MNPSPSPNGAIGRAAGGRFAQGNPGGPGNPYARQIAELRASLLDGITPADMRAVAEALVAKARDGDVRAIKELLDRTLGKPQEADLIERLDQLEARLQEINS